MDRETLGRVLLDPVRAALEGRQREFAVWEMGLCGTVAEEAWESETELGRSRRRRWRS